MKLNDLITETDYLALAAPGWPGYWEVVQGKGSPDPVIQQHIDTAVASRYKEYQQLHKGNQIADGNRRMQGQIFFNKKVPSTVAHCRAPWETLGINSYGDVFICQSPAWLPKFAGNINAVDSIYDILNSQTAKDIRQEILAGRYLYCNNNLCRFFSINTVTVAPPDDVVPLESVDSASIMLSQVPGNLIFDFDHTCNFKCPSCRPILVNNNKHLYIRKINNSIVEKIKRLVIDEIKDQPVEIRWAGGELFISQVYVELIDYIIRQKKSNIRHVIQTNGSYLKSKSELVERLLPYVSELRISFDAATADTYHRVRVNGQWNTLLENARWIIDLVKGKKLPLMITADFVVQRDNYKEIVLFKQLCTDLGIQQINFQKMWNWSTWPEEEFAKLNVYDSAHPDYDQVINMLQQTNTPGPGPRVYF